VLGLDGVAGLVARVARDPGRTSGVSLSDGARAVSDDQSGRLGDDVVLAAHVEAGRSRAVGGVDIDNAGDSDGTVLASSGHGSRRHGGLRGSGANKGEESGGVEGVHLERLVLFLGVLQRVSEFGRANASLLE